MNATDKAETQEKEDKLVIEEGQDGSVTVSGLPDEDQGGEEKDAATTEEKAPSSEEQQSEDTPDDSSGESQASSDEDHEDDTEAIREAKRARRRAKKQFQREQQREKDLRFNQLLKQNQELMQRLSAVENRTHGSELARINKAIEDQEVRINYARMKIAEATKNQDGEAMTEAQDLLYEARRAHEALNNLKRQSVQPKRTPTQGPDPTLQRYATAWMSKNSWYDPNKSDEDSAIAFAIDERLAKEGWDPRTQEYWDELDSRLQKRLPHRYTQADEDEPVVRRPRSVVTGSGKESAPAKGGRNTFVLNAEQVRAIKEAGMWDDPVARKKIINRYAAEQRNQRR